MTKVIVKRIILVLLIIFIVFGSISFYINYKSKEAHKKDINSNNTIIKFTDDALSNKIKEYVNGDITINKVLKIKKLDLSNNTIKNLDGLQYFTNLEELNISYNLITNISQLKHLKKLKLLDMNNNYITNIEPIRNLNNLEFPNINYNPIKDYTILIDKTNIYTKNLKSYHKDYTQEKINQIKQEKLEIIKNEQQAIQKAQSIINDIIKNDMTSLAKEYAIIDYLKEHITYQKTENQYILYDALVNNIGTENNIAYSFSYLLTLAQLDNYILISDNGMWNLVKIEDKYYEVDVSAYLNTNSYEYINTSSNKLKELHNYEANNLSKFTSADTIMSVEEQKNYKKQDLNP